MRAAVFGSSGGIGAAIVTALEARGDEVVEFSRSKDGFDLTAEPTIAAAAARHPGPFDLIFDATGALAVAGAGPEKTLATLDPAVMAAHFAVNAVGPALLLKHFARTMAKEGRPVFATLSARVGSIGDNRLGGWISYRAAKAALNQIVRTASIEIRRKRPEAIVVALHPGTVRTKLSSGYVERHPAVSPEEAAENLLRVIGGLRPEDTGSFFAWDGSRVPW